eukprot:1195122-Prorocentrum_minimum.AAC.1
MDPGPAQVVEFADNGGAPVPPADPLRNFLGPNTPGALPLKPLRITQPEGPSFVVVRPPLLTPPRPSKSPSRRGPPLWWCAHLC